MPEPSGGPIQIGSTVADIAAFLGEPFDGCGNLVINGLNSLNDAGSDELTFIHADKWSRSWQDAAAGAALVTRGIDVSGHDPSARAVILVEDAEIAMLHVLESFSKAAEHPMEPGIHPTAIIHESAQVDSGAHVGPHVTIGARSVIGNAVMLDAGVRIGSDVVIGDGTTLHANVVIEHTCCLGRGCRVHPSVVVGADGFGYRPDPEGGGLLKVPHLGTVHIGDDVEIGAGSCIDRGKFGATTIGDNTKLDNLVQVAHNVSIGRSTVIAAQAGIAGSAQIGDGVQIGAHAGIVEHLKVGDGARIGAKAGVIKNVAAGEVVAGIPAQPAKETLRQVAALRKLPEYLARQGRLKG
ncbi:MAG: UDP-3-O-(3-hydroxymyristoyl)glucosamine N-acyltransferase [Phycisphaerae bacterium]|nr:UDP-3-O-(3-hydroxymyristoyl)glucosamine N-acyltransferase [Phycisphaerae bacterium]|tara:strand:- start:210 stop:1265 length:1056 start_codon:yes stop_codon:yes gene_type:complete